MRPGDATAVVRTFFDAYLLRRNLEQTLACLTEEIHWIGTGKSGPACGQIQVKHILQEEFIQMPGPFIIEYDHMKETSSGGQVAMVLLTAVTCPEGK